MLKADKKYQEEIDCLEKHKENIRSWKISKNIRLDR